jgi:hypothetical protein
VDLQHRAGERVQQETAGMTVEEEAAYWKQRTRALRDKQKSLRTQGKTA